MSDRLGDLRAYLQTCTPQEREELQRALGLDVAPRHQLERDWNISATDILDAIASGSDLIQRGIRGVIADKAFYRYVLPALVDDGWQNEPIVGDRPYDAALRRGELRITIQVKMQRKAAGVPMTAKSRLYPNGDRFWVVETQKTRAGVDSQGDSTRPYRFGEFDILAVNLHPSCGDWSRFVYTVARWLVPDPTTPLNIYKYQPVPQGDSEDWTPDFGRCVEWLISRRPHEIGLLAR